MTPGYFIHVRSLAWDRLETLTQKAGRKGAKALTESQLHELSRLYPAVAVDVSRARRLGVDISYQRRINFLAIAAHGILYRRKHTHPFRKIVQFITRDYPRLFRSEWRPLLLAFGIFLLGALGSYTMVRMEPSTAYVFVPRGLDVEDSASVTSEDVSERYRRSPGSIMSAGITTNNIQVAFFAFALGITAAIGTGYILLANATMLGAFFAHFDNHGLTSVCYSYLVPHGVLEIFAIIVAGAAGMRLGLSLAVPGRMTRKDSLRVGAKQAVLLLLGTIPMFIIAGAIESFITPAYDIPPVAKVAIGIAAGGGVLLYLLLKARQPSLEEATVTTDALT